MSKISALIEELTKKQEKVDYLESLKKVLLGEHPDNEKEHSQELAKEMALLVIPLIDQLIKSIEDGVSISQVAPKSSTAPAGPYSASTDPVPASTQPLPPKDKPEVTHQEELEFSMNNRHLANKQVNVVSKDGKNRMPGKVVGLKAPDSVIVKTEAGTIQTSLSTIEII